MDFRRSSRFHHRIRSRGSAHWALVLQRFGYTVPRIAPQFDRAYRHAEENDVNDAAAIREAISRPQMRSKDVLCTQKVSGAARWACASSNAEPLVGARTQIRNRIPGLLARYGLCCVKT
jgi:transposase